MNAVTLAIRQAGGKRAVASALGVSYEAVRKWEAHGLPAERVLKVEKLSGVSRHLLRPDIYPVESTSP